MRRSAILVCIFLALGVISSEAQTLLDYLKNYDQGVGLSYYRIAGRHDYDTGETIRANYIVASWTHGVYVPIVSLGEDLSIGIEPSLMLEAGYTPDYHQPMLGLNAPLMAMLKYGTDAQFFGKVQDGFGIGLGYRIHLLFLVFNDQDGAAYGTHGPVAALEYSHIRANGKLIKLQLYGTLGAISSDIDAKSALLFDDFHGHLDFTAITLAFTWISSFQ